MVYRDHRGVAARQLLIVSIRITPVFPARGSYDAPRRFRQFKSTKSRDVIKVRPMSENAEPKKKMAELNRAEWDALSDVEKTAVRKALAAYQNSPGDSINMAMLRGVRAYMAIMKAAGK